MSWLTELGASFWLPHLTPEVQALLRIAYSALLIGTILLALPHGRRFFLSERWGGYGRAEPAVDLIQNPTVLPFALAIWVGAALLLGAGAWTPWTSLATVLVSRYYFVQMRRRGLLRGMGAPGFMIYWLGVAVCLLEFTRWNAPSLQRLAVLAAQVDLAAIILVAGIYTITAGYARNEGMEFGLANPEWGYWWRAYSALPPAHPIFRGLNHLAWSTTVLIGVLGLLPPTRALAGALLVGCFAFIATQIRLALLCPTVMAAGLIFLADGSGLAAVAGALTPSWLVATTPGPQALHVGTGLGVGVLAYLVLLPFAYGGMAWNVYGRRRLPGPLQRALNVYVNAIGLSLWQVFTQDIANFYVVVHEAPCHRPRRLVSSYRGFRPGRARAAASARGRFAHVAESITLTSLFMTMKYFPDDRALFDEGLLRYARTIACEPGARLVFEYVSLRKDADGFTHVPVAEFVVDPVHGAVVERTLVPSVSSRGVNAQSLVFEDTPPGTCLPVAS